MRVLRPAAVLHRQDRARAADLAAGDQAEAEAGTAETVVARETAGARRAAADGIAQGQADTGLAVARAEAGADRAGTPVQELNDSIRLRVGWNTLISRAKRGFGRRSGGSSELRIRDANAMTILRVAMEGQKQSSGGTLSEQAYRLALRASG
ncbi:MAG: hypothetical protein ACRD8A_09700 [Candidatus Acidiferrales bacterium]